MPSQPSKSRALDQFYTLPNVAESCLLRLQLYLGQSVKDYHFVEPSAGEGAFLRLLPKKRSVGIDLSPSRNLEKGLVIQRQDFFSWLPFEVAGRKYVVIGNPPFGKNASLALRFMNHAAIFADVIGFILPRTFEKDSMIKKIDGHFHLADQIGLSPNSFVHDNLPYSVPVVFQIWQRKKAVRQKEKFPTKHEDFDFLKNPEAASFAFQRVGVAAGKVSREGLLRSPQSHYFIKAKSPHVERILSQIDWSEIKCKTAGNPSIGKAELIIQYERFC